MKRRHLLIAGSCAPVLLFARKSWGAGLEIEEVATSEAPDVNPASAEHESYLMPERLERPDPATDEGGLWGMMDREEKKLLRSPLILRDPALKNYVQSLACRLGGAHCPDIRVHLMRIPSFNAYMAPNGMMMVWTGLLLRVENEAQLAAILGHEIAHYLHRHSVERLRDIRTRSAFGQFVGGFGLVGALGQVALLAGAFAYSREHEQEADRIGAELMRRAGYDAAEAARIWRNLHEEAKAGNVRQSLFFATHPSPQERQENLAQYAKEKESGGVIGEAAYRKATGRFLEEWLEEEVKRGQYAESLVLLSRLLAQQNAPTALLSHYRGEIYRLRGAEGDQERALADYRTAASLPETPPQTFRGMGFIARQQGDLPTAQQAFARYLERKPEAPDAAFIKTYLTEDAPL
jgi:predicted Zn-dependent protease